MLYCSATLGIFWWFKGKRKLIHLSLRKIVNKIWRRSQRLIMMQNSTLENFILQKDYSSTNKTTDNSFLTSLQNLFLVNVLKFAPVKRNRWNQLVLFLHYIYLFKRNNKDTIPFNTGRKLNVHRRSENVQGVSWTSYVHLAYIPCPGGKQRHGCTFYCLYCWIWIVICPLLLVLLQLDLSGHIPNPFKRLKWSVLRKQSTASSR